MLHEKVIIIILEWYEREQQKSLNKNYKLVLMEPLKSIGMAQLGWKKHNHVISTSYSLHLLHELILNYFNRYSLASHGSNLFLLYWWAIINDFNDPKCHKTFKSSAREKDRNY